MYQEEKLNIKRNAAKFWIDGFRHSVKTIFLPESFKKFSFKDVYEEFEKSYKVFHGVDEIPDDDEEKFEELYDSLDK